MISRQSLRGVSLIEALVALGVMAFGMLALVGVQATLRSNGDFSRQRAEAVRIAQESMEEWRAITGLEADAGSTDYTDLASDGPTAVAGINASYARSRTVSNIGGTLSTGARAGKVLLVSVAWQDRAGQAQVVQLSSVIAGVAPELAGSLTLPPQGTPSRQPRARSRTIPTLAKDLGNGTSVFKPPQPGGGSVSWVFNNTTGVITGLCSGLPTDPVAADVATCANNTQAQLVSGYVRFASTGSQPNEAEAENPTGTVLNLNMSVQLTSTGHGAPGFTCFDDSTDDASQASVRVRVAYYCAVISNTNGLWAGRTYINPLGFSTPTATSAWVISDTGGANRKVCRYTTLADDGNSSSRNIDHPLNYAAGLTAGLAYAALANQNFLVISAAHNCPVDANVTPVNARTLLHQDGGTTYWNTPPT